MTHKDFRVNVNVSMGIRGSYSKPLIKATLKNDMKQIDELTLNKS